MMNRIILLCVAAFAVCSCSAQIPVKAPAASKEIVRVNGTKMYAHIVAKGETLYTLCRNYGITASELQKHNPVLADGLKEGQLLYIPVEANPKSVSSDDAENGRAEAVREDKSGKEKQNDGEARAQEFSGLFPGDYSQNGYRQGTTHNPYRRTEKSENCITLVLPLTGNNGTANNNYMDFYAGALIAAADLKAAGHNLTVNVIDHAPNVSAEAILSSDKLRSSDLVIGPVRSAAISRFIGFSNDNCIPLVSPLDPSADSLVEEGAFLFQAPLSQSLQNDALSRLVIGKYRKSVSEGVIPDVIVVYQEDNREKAMAAELAQSLSEYGIAVRHICYDILRGRTVDGEFREKIPADRKSFVVVASNNEAFASDALRNIDLIAAGDGLITIFGTNRWRGFEAINLSLFYKYSMTLAMPYYVDLESERVRDFIRRFRSLCNTEPSANAFTGYDIMYYFAEALRNGLRELLAEYREAVRNGDGYAAAGKLSIINAVLGEASMLQQNFDFRKSATEKNESGFSNRSTKPVTYNPDLTVSVIAP